MLQLLLLLRPRRGQRFVEDGFEEAAAFSLGGGELRFQPVAEGHQFFNLGNNVLLLSEGRDWQLQRPYVADVNAANSNSF